MCLCVNRLFIYRLFINMVDWFRICSKGLIMEQLIRCWPMRTPVTIWSDVLITCASHHLRFVFFGAGPAVPWLLMINHPHPQWSGPQRPPSPCPWVRPTWLILSHCHPSRMSPRSVQHTAHLSTYFALVTKVSIKRALSSLNAFYFRVQKGWNCFLWKSQAVTTVLWGQVIERACLDWCQEPVS